MRENLCPELHWVAVVDGAGRRRLEMRWEQPVGAVVPMRSTARVAASRAA
ncbi:hypothetical protein GCU67_18365 [Modestobacter muralis]|uniref:Uncharacterized protein n=1 Tax=Modestobacter muralis TaxID=1608614 RepID=A0A6P0F1Y4_9ACTN|nr:hypothetical protein [Modestobacter muralis]NEK96114.1 hypothetical protein [Modestobacter muralis]NEN53002.1 hypothetical protein [Modestobacter muralis]